VSRYRFRESDIYLPGTDIPKNRPGITEADLSPRDSEFNKSRLRLCIKAKSPVATPGFLVGNLRAHSFLAMIGIPASFHSGKPPRNQ
jgi:hypothetical protein